MWAAVGVVVIAICALLMFLVGSIVYYKLEKRRLK